ncbi:MAG: hypothetical protein OXH50_14930 [Gemmatimonadetes bacterium]|nr:hypothetical protein [Gemmatimonadota bacterium]
MKRTNDSGKGWIERPGNAGKLYRLLLAVCGLLLALDLLDVLGIFHKHVHHDAEGWLGFYSFFGFAAYAFIVGAGWVWRAVVGRGPDYYDRDSSGEAGGSEVSTSDGVRSSREDSASDRDPSR